MTRKEVVKAYNIPVGAHIVVNEGQKIKAGNVLVKIVRASMARQVISPEVFLSCN